MKKIKKAVIPAAGLGTRLLPASKALPKEMLPIVDKPALQYIVEEAAASGIEEILIVTRIGKTAIENHFDRNIEIEQELEKKGRYDLLEEVKKISDMAQILYIRQAEARGLGDAVYCARSFVGNDPFAIMLGDCVVYSEDEPCLKQMMGVYEETGGSNVIGTRLVDPKTIYKYGCIAGTKIDDRLYKIDHLVEKPRVEDAPSNMAITGRYVINPQIMDYLRDLAPGAGGEIQLTDALNHMAKDEESYAFAFDGIRYDTGSKNGYLEAIVDFAMRDEGISEIFLDHMRKVVKKADEEGL